MISNSNRVWMKVVPGIAGIIGLSAALAVPSWAGESRQQVVADSLVSQAESVESTEAESVDTESIEAVPLETESVEVESVDVPMSDDGAMESESSEVEMPGVESLEIDASETEVLPDASEAGEMDENVDVEATEVEEDSLLQSPTVEETSPDISTNELQQFAATIPHLVTIEQTGQEQISQAIAQSGLDRDRFYEIYQNQGQPASEGAVDGGATPEEQSSFETALAQIEAIEQDVASQQQDVIAASGIAPERFNEIMDTVLNDPQLQLEVQDLMVQ